MTPFTRSQTIREISARPANTAPILPTIAKLGTTKYAVITSWFAMKLDTSFPFFDCFLTSFWINGNVRDKIILPVNHIAQSDLLYLRHAGSSIDQALLAYGTLRNMIKEDDFWQAEDLYVLITNDYQGYLAVNLDDNWQYISFDPGKLINNIAPEHIVMVFNEINSFDQWEE